MSNEGRRASDFSGTRRCTYSAYPGKNDQHCLVWHGLECLLSVQLELQQISGKEIKVGPK